MNALHNPWPCPFDARGRLARLFGAPLLRSLLLPLLLVPLAELAAPSGATADAGGPKGDGPCYFAAVEYCCGTNPVDCEFAGTGWVWANEYGGESASECRPLLDQAVSHYRQELGCWVRSSQCVLNAGAGRRCTTNGGEVEPLPDGP